MEEKYWNCWKVVEIFSTKSPSGDVVNFFSSFSHPADVKVLDLGCGGGRHAVWLARHGFDVFACDMHEQMIVVASQRMSVYGKANRVCMASMLSLPYSEGKFNVVVSTGVLHNAFCYNDLVKSYQEVSRILTEGGQFFLTIFTDAYISEELRQNNVNEKYLYVTKDDVRMLLLPVETLHSLANLANLHLEHVIREYITHVETGKRAVLSAFMQDASLICL